LFNTGRDAVLNLERGRPASEAVRVNLDKVEAKLEFVRQARCLFDRQCLRLGIKNHDRSFEIIPQLLDEAANCTQRSIKWRAGSNHFQDFVLRVRQRFLTLTIGDIGNTDSNQTFFVGRQLTETYFARKMSPG